MKVTEASILTLALLLFAGNTAISADGQGTAYSGAELLPAGGGQTNQDRYRAIAESIPARHIQIAVAANPSTPPNVLARLAAEDCQAVRIASALNKTGSSEREVSR